MASMHFGSLLDPLTMNVQRQWKSIASHIHDSLLELEGPRSQEEVIHALTRLLHDPRYTLLIAQKFRPILMILCALWLDHDEEHDAKLAALALLVNPHEELFPILSAFLREFFAEDLMANVSTSSPIDKLHLHLLAYYRILVACPHISASFGWSPEFLSTLISLPHQDAGVRYLAVRCYALHMHMTETERDDLQLRVIGPTGVSDITIETGKHPSGEPKLLDGWLLPALEEKRIQESRQAMLQEHDFYEDGDPIMRIGIDHLTRRVVDVHGILFLREPSPTSTASRFVMTASAVSTLRELAVRTSLRIPTLLSSPPSSGKTLLLNHLASLLYPQKPNQVVTLHLSDTSLDARSLLGSYVSSTRRPGTFEWQEGLIVRAMKDGLWLVLEDVDRASSDVLGTLVPLLESTGVHKHIGASASLDVPGHGRVDALEGFMVFATRSLALTPTGKLPSPTFLGANKFSCVDIYPPTDDDLATIIHSLCPRLGICGTRALIRAWKAAQNLGHALGVRENRIRDLETWCKRVESLLGAVTNSNMDVDTEGMVELPHIYPHLALREEMFLEARDVFFGAGAFSETSRSHVTRIARMFAEHLGLSHERAEWVMEGRIPELQLVKNSNGHITTLQIGKTSLPALPTSFDLLAAPKRPFAMHRPALLLTERIATCVSFSEPVLLVGETGTGKTMLISHIASLLNRTLVSLNLSHQTESSDLVGGFKPIDTRIPGGELQRRFTEIFSRTFSRRKNSKFEEAVRKAVNEGKWKRAVGMWKESTSLALNKIRERSEEGRQFLREPGDVLGHPTEVPSYNSDNPRKRRRITGEAGSVQESEWMAFAREVETFDIQHVRGKGKFAFGFVEGPLTEALRNGSWVLLDEINLASSETLECISSILQGPTASVILTEQGSFSPIPRHTDFRLFACMNPPTDVGKKDLPPNIRSRFTEIYVPPADSDRETLLTIIQQYIGHCALVDKRAMLDVAEFYMAVKTLAENRELADSSNHRPHFSMRTLTRALTFTSDTVAMFGLRRALWEGCLMAFSMALNEKSTVLVRNLAEKHLLGSIKNVHAMMSQIPTVPGSGQPEGFERIGPFWLECGSLQLDPASEYILTPSVQSKLVDLARAVLTRRFPVLIEGPTSSGKTSAVEYLARRTGHRFVRINNHEHTDIQEYLGTYVSDTETGKLIFRDGILVRALRNGDWVVLDELNLAPTDVLEALNRLLDDNRELVIPETQEVVKPHPHFVLFATQNPPGLYAGRKVLSRAFRNRFLEVHFDDVPRSELQTILSERCRIPDSYAQRIVSVFQELSNRRQAGRIFETKHGFVTLRDLFRWAGREAVNTQQLAQNGYMLLAERARRPDDKAVVKEIIEAVMKEHINVDTLYDVQGQEADVAARLGIPLLSSSRVIWTSAMKRLFVLVTNALLFNEPVLLVGPTGSGKTSVCQLYAGAASKELTSLNCHQSTETADLIGGQRPLRNRHFTQSQLIEQARIELRTYEDVASVTEKTQDVEGTLQLVKKLLTVSTLSPAASIPLKKLRQSLQQSTALFEWHDGPLVHAMRTGEVFLLDEISLADDSVLERLNSVLEPTRSIVLAERGGFDIEHAQVTANPGFQLLATMNPGGDYGKKELSPALRNRFTEIWVPQVEARSDRRLIIDKSWRHNTLRRYTDHVLHFTEWLANAVAEPSIASLRDLLTWVDFSNEVCDSNLHVNLDILFHHAAHLVFLDGLESSPYTSGRSTDFLHDIRERGRAELEGLVPIGEERSQIFDGIFHRTSNMVYFGAFGIPQGPYESTIGDFSLRATTTLDNMRRLVRACQISKPILLEGSPGVGKTSLVSALCNISGHRLCRINLSEQTDLMDLFGSDLPVEGGTPGDFAWKDAAFLRAMQVGDWVLLDEMNLAPQSILEGLNAVLDHRGTVFIPELGRSFVKHSRFRIFAAQNPLHEGGGRKGLPRSFLDRFTKVHITALSSDDFLLICQALFPTLPIDQLRAIISFNARLHEETMIKHSFGREGTPWDFNLRDIIRWATLLTNPSSLASDRYIHLDTVYLQRFRTEVDRSRAIELFREVFTLSQVTIPSPWVSTTPRFAQFGSTLLARGDCGTVIDSVEIQRHLRPLASVSECMSRGWLTIISGSAGAGKTHLVRYLAAAAGRHLREFSMNSGVDTSDLLGGFEQALGDNLGAPHFEWMDGPLVQAIKDGHWLVLDNANLCSPSVLDRLNSLCETDGFLVLTERGLAQGEPLILRPHPHFRIILTLDPRNGELSRAMRNRGIEIHLPTDFTAPQDQLRLQASIRTSPLSESTVYAKMDDLAIQFELLRRCNSQLPKPRGASDLNAVRGGLLCNDSVSSAMMDQVVFDRIESSDDPRLNAYVHALFSLRVTSPSQTLILSRMLLALDRATEAETFDILLKRMRQTSILKLRHAIETTIANTQGVPLNFILHQPCDLSMNPNLLPKGPSDADILTTQQRILSMAIELLVHLHFYDHRKVSWDTLGHSVFHQSRMLVNVKGASLTSTPGTAVIFPLYSSVMEFAHNILGNLHQYRQEEQLSLLEDLEQVVHIAEHLRNYSSSTQFDFTSSKVISAFLRDSISKNTTLRQSPISIHLRTLENDVSLTSGHGMQEIWGGLVAPKPPQSTVVVVTRLDQLGINLDPRQPSYGKLRMDAFSAMALSTLGITRSRGDHQSIVALCKDLEQRLTTDVVVHPKSFPAYPHHIAIAELNFLSAVLTGNDRHTIVRIGESLIQLTSQTPYASLARITQVQHFLWAADIREDHSADHITALVSLFQRWISAINDFSCNGRIPESHQGPEILFRPIILQHINAICRHDQNLDNLDTHENSLYLEAQLLVHRCRETLNDRMLQTLDVWISVLLVVAKCFKQTYSPETMQAMELAVSRHRHFRASSEFVELLSRTAHPQLSRIVQDRLLPASRRLDVSPNGTDKISSLGNAWVAMGLALLELYVPNVPLDPVAAERCIVDFWKCREVETLAQLNIHEAAQKMIAGNDDNPMISMLKGRLNTTRDKLHNSADSSVFRDLDIHSLHELHRELTQFLANFVTSPKFDAIVRDLEGGQEAVDGRVLMVQKAISEFVMRVELAYPHLADIIEPVSMAMSQLVFGLHLLHYAYRHRTGDQKFANRFRTLIDFPTVASVGSIRTITPQNPASSTQLLLNLVATAYDELQSPSVEGFREIDDLNNRLIGLWQEDRDEEEKAVHESKSLYRLKNLDYNVQKEDEFEEQEFRDMFPTYEHESVKTLEDARPAFVKPIKPVKGRRVSDEDINRVYHIHLWVVEPPNPKCRNGLNEEFQELRKLWISNALDTHSSWLSQTVDSESLPYQVQLLSDATKELMEQRSVTSSAYSFYHDSNVPEARKVISVVHSMQGRLRQLMGEWPEQMVLHHIMARCESVIKLDIRSPVAKILTALEQLLLQTEDWEIYSNRENTLKPQQLLLSGLIVEWRRLELLCWSQLLEAQALGFSAGTAEWWFRLYELTIRGTLAASAEGKASLSAYFARMIPLLEQYFSAGSLGQHSARIQLLKSFSKYAEKLSIIKSGSESGALARASRILCSLHNFYDQFSSQISHSFAEKRGILEKELLNFIRLASWKDVNVHALRQSAQRTHRHLYRCVRKFRDLLREPVAPFFSHKSQEEYDMDQSKINFLALDTIPPVVFPTIISSDRVLLHLLELPQTFSKFKSLLTSYGRPIVESIPFHFIEDLAGQIVNTVTTLSRETNEASNNMRLHKTLVMRKRKAWVDLLRELKRAGFSSRLKPEILEQQQSKVWLMDCLNLTLPKDDLSSNIVSKGEYYFNRLLISMPELRNSLASHHGDLPTRELERVVAFVESCFSLALSSRARFANDYLSYQDAKRVARRLRQLSSSQGTTIVACDITPWLELCCKLEDALWEVSSRCVDFSMLNGANRLSSLVTEAISAHLLAIRNVRQSLSMVYDNVRLTREGLMNSEEHRILHEARALVLSTTAALKNWACQEPCIRHLCNPVLLWLESAIPDIDDGRTDETSSEGTQYGNVIDRFLVIVQGILSFDISAESSDNDRPPDRYASESERLSTSVSRLFALKSISLTLSSFVKELSVLSTRRVEKIQAVLPFVDAYLALIHDYLLIQAHLSKALLKLSFVLCNVAHSISTQGFCKPHDVEDQSGGHEGDGTEIQDGTGMGQGTGSKNISDQIEDEGQVEGLRGEETSEDQAENGDTNEDGIEIEEDFEGNMEDLDDGEAEHGSGSDQDGQPEDQVGEVNPSDPDAIDEKLWGNGNVEKQTTEDQKCKDNLENLENISGMVGKDQKDRHDDQDGGSTRPEESLQGDRQDDSDLPEEYPIEAGKQMNEFVPEVDTLDLPDDLTMPAEDGQGDKSIDAEDDLTQEGDLEESKHAMEDGKSAPDDLEEVECSPSPSANEHEMVEKDERASLQPAQQDVDPEAEQVPDPVAPSTADISPSENAKDSAAELTTRGANGVAQSDVLDNEKTLATGITPGEDTTREDVTSAEDVGAGQEPSIGLPNPLRSLGDTLKELQRRFDQIGDPAKPDIPSTPRVDDPLQEVNYVQEGTEDDHDLQALGPTSPDQIVKLSELNINDQPAADLSDSMDVEEPNVDDQEVITRDVMHTVIGSSPTSKPADVPDAVTGRELSSNRPDRPPLHQIPSEVSVAVTGTDADHPSVGQSVENWVELAVKKWQETGHADSRAMEMWRLYDSLTQELSYSLCEQLRLILEPTLATRLRGDYRTGKRLNMKKIIPYIASEYTKDKIWLRRTRPSQREYQVLIALDDSRSMAESHSVHLAYETLALVSKALNRLESGEVAIARFGESVEMVHRFEDGMVGDREGEKVMRSFKFEQRKTDVLGLVQTSLKVLTQAREGRSLGGSRSQNADLWQLEIIISDGICQDHDKLRTVLRKAEEQRIMMVFIIVDSLHAHRISSSSGSIEDSKDPQNTILSMNTVSYKDLGGGRMELQMERYLDTFPFQYYVVLRSVDALPDVLSGTLKQFFERISED